MYSRRGRIQSRSEGSESSRAFSWLAFEHLLDKQGVRSKFSLPFVDMPYSSKCPSEGGADLGVHYDATLVTRISLFHLVIIRVQDRVSLQLVLLQRLAL